MRRKMKSQLNKILKIIIIISLFSFSKSYSIENVSEFTDAIDEVREEFNNISEASTEQSKIIDEALKEIDKATEYVQEAIDNNKPEDAIITLEFIEKSLTDVESIIPQEFGSDMSNIDTSAIAKEDMDVVNEVTAQMKTAKEEKLKDFMSDLIDLNQKGIDTITISENLNSLGIDTIELDLNLDEKKKMETWTKEEWANSYKGSVLTSDGSEVITDQEINTKVGDLEQKLQANTAAILDKRSSLTELQTKIDPLSGQITELKTQKTNLLAKYNEEILKQSSTILSDEEISESKKLADQFNSQLSNLTDQIKTAEQQSNSLQEQVQSLNLELANEIANKTQLQTNINELNNQLSANQNILSKKTLELDQLKNTNLNTKIASLNEKLQSASRERDFIQTDFERSIDLEVDAIERYHTALGNIDSKNFDDEVEFSIREVGVIMDADPRKHRAFELEKYATYAGFSDDYIQKGIEAINNDDWGRQRELYNEVAKKLSKNPEWTVDIPSNAELNVMIEEDKAIQAAALASMQINEINSAWDKKINEQVKDIQPLAALNLLTIKSAATWEGMREHSFLVEETNKLLAGQNLEAKFEAYEKAQQAYDEYMNKDWRSVNWQGYSLNKALDLQTKKNELFFEAKDIEWDAERQARENLYAAVESAKSKYNEIISQENPELKSVKEKVTKILKDVPTFADSAENLAGLDPATLRARLIDITLGNNNESEALEAARNAIAEIGEAPVSEYMTGPYWEMTNVKAAAIVRSKKYDWVDDYEYINAYYEESLNLNSSQREYVEGELKGLLGQNNIKLQTLESKISDLSNELNLTKEESQNLTTEISRLENELSSLKNSEIEIQNQISDLSNQFSSKENLIVEKTQNLASLQEQLNPLNDKMNELEGQRAELDAKLNTQLATIANQIESQGQANNKANALKAQFESQIAQLDGQLKNYENQSLEINSQLASLTTELSTLETETPEIANQIESLNQDLENFINIKADLAMASAEKYNIDIHEKVVDAVKPLENKSIISIEGTNIFRVVESDELLDNKGKFKIPTGTLTLKGEVYTAGAVQPEKLFSFAKINSDEEINGKILELEKQFEAGTLSEEELRSQRNSLNATRSNMKVEFSEIAAEQFASTGALKGGEQAYTGSTLGSWVLVNAITGEQMANPLTGHSGSIVCEGSTCGQGGSLANQAASFGGMYVLESLADQNGNVAGRCAGGGCKFDVDTLRVLGPNKIEGNVFNERGEGLFQGAFTSSELNEIEKYGMTSGQRQKAVDYALKNNIKFNASDFVDQDSLETQAKAVAYAAKTNTAISKINKTAGSYVKFKTDNFTRKFSSTLTYTGETFSGSSSASPTASFQVVDGQIVKKTASEIAQAQSAAQEAASAAQEAASAAQEATQVAQAAAQEAASAAQEAAEEVAQVASSVITGNDVEELSKLANDALGAWVLVDAATGKQMTNPINGYSGSSVCTASVCGAEGSFGKEAASFGGVYVLERLADPETGNVAGSCAGGDCQFDLGN